MRKWENPNYNKIYLDLLKAKFPDKVDIYSNLLTNKKLSVLDVIKLNEAIFGKSTQEDQKQNQKYKAYDKSSIMEILRYQKKYRLNNSQLARHFQLSRNTVASWKKKFIV
jgi:DNA-binding transcriptional regulator YiaG